MSDNKFSVPLSTEAKSLLAEFHQKLRHQYINDRMISGIDHFVSSYQEIKDESWPCCSTYEDFDDLPDHIRQECINEHNFAPEIFLKSIKQDADRILPDFRQNFLSGREPVVEMLNKNINLLKNKRIIDFACNSGFYTFFAAENKCKHVIGVDVREDNILIANTIRKTTKYQNLPNLDFQIGDLHNHENNLRLCHEADVILLFGILYHVHDHYDILRSTCLPNVETVLIETSIHIDVNPTMSWKIEPTFELIAGCLNDQTKIPVGYPSVSYLDMIMDLLGYYRSYHAYHDIYISASMADKFKMPRACLIYQR